MWEIKREPLLAALSILDLIPDKLGIPSSEYIYARSHNGKVKLSMASYIAGEVEVEGKGEWPIKKDFFIDRRTFMPWVLAAREIKNKNTFQFDRHKNQLLLQHGNRKLALDSQSKVKGYGDTHKIRKGKHSSIPVSSALKEMLLCGKNCAVSDAVVPHLNTVFVTKGKGGSLGMEAYAASDKVFYFGSGKLDSGKIQSSIPFPLFLISLLEVQGLQKISWIGKYIVLKFEQGIIWQPISEEALKSFPIKQIQKHAKKSDDLAVAFAASSRRFTRLMVRLGYYLQSVRRKDWVAQISGKKDKKYVYVRTSIPGANFVEKLTTSERLKRDIVLEWPLDVLEPTFEFLSKKTKKLGLIVRIDKKHGVSYVRTGSYWLAIPSKQE